MSTFYRNVFLEFLSQYYQLSFYQVTVVTFVNDCSENFKELDRNIDAIDLYTLKNTRTFQKNISFDDLQGTIIEDFLNLENNKIIKREELKKDYLDPYSKKHLFDMEFSTIVISPVINEELKAIVLYYLNNETSINLLSEKCSNKLYVNLVTSQKNEAINELKEFAEKQFHNCWCFVSGKNNSVFLSETLSEYFNGQFEVSISYDDLLERLLNLQFTKKTEVDWHDGVVLTFEKGKSNENSSLLAIDNITKHPFDNDFTILYYRYVGLLDITFKEILQTIENYALKYIENDEFLVYKCSDKSLLYLINKKIDKRILEKMKKTKDNYILTYLRSGIEINSKADLLKVVEYLEINEDQYFVKDHYLYYRQKMNEYSYKKDRAQSKITKIEQKLIWNSHTREIKGRIYIAESMLFEQNNLLELQMISQKRVVELLLSDNCEMPFMFIDALTLSKRQMWEYLKKIKNKYSDKWGIILLNNNLTVDELLKIIEKLKALEIKYYLSSKVFTNFEFLSLTKNANGLYLYNKEVEKIVTSDVLVLKNFLTYFLDQGHEIIIDGSNDLLTRFDHQNIYYITK